jgi:hypothetical protein
MTEERKPFVSVGAFWIRPDGAVTGSLEIGDRTIRAKIVETGDSRPRPSHEIVTDNDEETKIGSLWEPDGTKQTKTALSGSLELDGRGGPKIRLWIFENDKKDRNGVVKEERPDYRVSAVEDEELGIIKKDFKTGKRLTVPNSAPPARPEPAAPAEISDDDVPF